MTSFNDCSRIVGEHVTDLYNSAAVRRSAENSLRRYRLGSTCAARPRPRSDSGEATSSIAVRHKCKALHLFFRVALVLSRKAICLLTGPRTYTMICSLDGFLPEPGNVIKSRFRIPVQIEEFTSTLTS